MMLSFYKAFEDAHRGSHESVLQRLRAYTPVLQALLQEHANGHEQATALDIGCGRGEWLQLLGEMGFKAWGADLDEGMLEASRQLGLDVRLQDGLQALKEQESNSLALVSMFHLVEHVPFEILQALCIEALRVIKPGGMVLIETPNPENLVVGTSSFYLDPTHSKPIPQQLLKFVLDHAGFQETHVLRLNHPENIAQAKRFRLVNVLFHVSPDYAVLAVKGQLQNAQAASLLQQGVQQLKGYNLEQLSELLYEKQQVQVNELNNALQQRQLEIQQLNSTVAALHQEMMQMRNWPLYALKRIVGKLKRMLQPPKRHNTVFVDVSAIAHTDLNTGIERVVKAYLQALQQLPQFEVMPVVLTDRGGRWHYEQHPHFPSPRSGPAAEPQFGRGDVLWCLDFFPNPVHEAEKAGLYGQIRASGTRLVFQVYDLLPITHPEFFPPGAATVHEHWMHSIYRCADDLVCISAAVADAARQWAASRQLPAGPRLHAVHLGANLPVDGPADAHGASTDWPELQALPQLPFLLSVGTLEPRKGHDQALDAFDLLWAEGQPLMYVIVGREGWKNTPAEHRHYIDNLCARIRQHPELGKRLFWLEGAPDAVLNALYARATAVLVPSRQEGYGLPLIEAAHQGASLLVRDIPVFREVAGQQARYFSGDSAAQLAQAIQECVAAEAVPAALPVMTWSQSLGKVLSALGFE